MSRISVRGETKSRHTAEWATVFSRRAAIIGCVVLGRSLRKNIVLSTHHHYACGLGKLDENVLNTLEGVNGQAVLRQLIGKDIWCAARRCSRGSIG